MPANHHYTHKGGVMEGVHKAAAGCYDQMAVKHQDDFGASDTPFRHFNNFVKKRLLQDTLDLLHDCGVRAVAVLDLASGRGGDLYKWVYQQSPKLSKQTKLLPPESITKAVEYHCYDISPLSIEEATARYSKRPNDLSTPFTASFTVANCFSDEFIERLLPQHPLFGKFHVVSCQFAFHYACQTREGMAHVLRGCCAALAPGGVFVATIVDSDEIKRRLTEGGIASGPKYTIAFRDAARADCADNLALGMQYHFLLDDFVDCDEYFVPIGDLLQTAAEVGFKVLPAGGSFRNYLSTYATDPKALTLTADDTNLVSIYRTVMLQKK